MSENYTKSKLVKQVRDEFPGLTLLQAEKAIDVIFEKITKAMEEKNRVELRGFGSFSVRDRDARTARNPRTGGSVEVGKRSSVYFRAGRLLNERINK